jgi:hypothetical protein
MKRISAPEQTREHLRALIEGRLGTAPDRSSLVLLAGRSSRLNRSRALRAGRWRSKGLSEWISAWSDEDGRRNGRILRAARARTWGWPRTRRYNEPFNELGRSPLRQSCPDYIIAMRGYDFREGHGATFEIWHLLRYGLLQSNDTRPLRSCWCIYFLCANEN